MSVAEFDLLPGGRIFENDTSIATEVCGVISGVTGIAITVNVTIGAESIWGPSEDYRLYR